LSGIVISYLLIAFATSITMVYLGEFLFGVALSICMPTIIVGTAGSVSMAASGMAISITMCGQNLAQFLCPYLLNPITAALGTGSNNNQLAFLLGAGLTAVLAVAAAIWALRGQKATN
ncbi:MAG: MFS transporter, partial [Oscillospiraceae bacterium]